MDLGYPALEDLDGYPDGSRERQTRTGGWAIHVGGSWRRSTAPTD